MDGKVSLKTMDGKRNETITDGWKKMDGKTKADS